MRNLLIVCNPSRADAIAAAIELQQNLASTFGIYPISDVDIPGITKSSLTDLPQLEVAIVLGGDGTHRAVVTGCGDVPIAGISTGTNNAFPETRLLALPYVFRSVDHVRHVVDGQIGDNGTLTFGYSWQQADTTGNMWGALPFVNTDGTPTEHGFVSLWVAGPERVGVAWLDGRHTAEGTDEAQRSSDAHAGHGGHGDGTAEAGTTPAEGDVRASGGAAQAAAEQAEQAGQGHGNA